MWYTDKRYTSKESVSLIEKRGMLLLKQQHRYL